MIHFVLILFGLGILVALGAIQDVATMLFA